MWGEFAFNPPYTGADISAVNGVPLPKSYLDFMRQHNGGEGDIGETWFVLFPIGELQEINDAYGISDDLPGCILIGSNGGEEFYGLRADGIFFNVPSIFDESDVTLLCDDIAELADAVNTFWNAM